jgi:hypothetical protein
MQTDLFGNQIPSNEPKKKLTAAETQHNQLISIYGESEGNICGNCKHFIRKRFSNVYFKCGKSHVSNSAATDWRSRWNACGLFELKSTES